MSVVLENSERTAKLIKELCSSFYQNEVKIRVKRIPPEVHLQFFEADGNQVASFGLIEQPNCCGVMILTKIGVQPIYRRKGICKEILRLSEAIAKAYGYSALSGTVDLTHQQIAEATILKNGWVKMREFKNNRTSNMIGYFFKGLA